MRHSIFTSHSVANEPSKLVSFSHNDLERRAENRPDDCLDVALDDPQSRYFMFLDGLFISMKHANTPFTRDQIEALKPDLENAVLLGWTPDEVPRISVNATISQDHLPDDYKLVHPREYYLSGAIDDPLMGQFAQAASFATWTKNNLFCGCCGTKTKSRSGGYSRKCPSCGHIVFPRTDPVAIMLIVDEARDRCLLGRSPHFGPQMYSALAGFLEPGETIEDTVRRETKEEAGIEIGRVRYHASQPWPMPHTLMIGCFAEALTTDIDFDREELADCDWFTRDQVAHRLSHLEGEDRMAPPEGAIAHLLMREWVNWDR